MKYTLWDKDIISPPVITEYVGGNGEVIDYYTRYVHQPITPSFESVSAPNGDNGVGIQPKHYIVCKGIPPILTDLSNAENGTATGGCRFYGWGVRARNGHGRAQWLNGACSRRGTRRAWMTLWVTRVNLR